MLAEMTTPVMRDVYADAPLEEDEQFAVKAYPADLARDGTVSRKNVDFFPLGLEGMAIVLGAFVVWRKLAASSPSVSSAPSCSPSPSEARS